MKGRPSQTAEWMCLCRALERRKPARSRIVDDPWAEHFLSALSRSALAVSAPWLGANLFPASVVRYILARQRFTDDHLAVALERGVDQLVVLGAGYDTRAWRFADRLAVVYEVDHPATAARKAELVEGLLVPAVDRRVIPADLSVADLEAVMGAAGLDRSRPTFVAWEGVTMYLDRPAVLKTLSALRRLMAPGSLLSMDFWWDSELAGIRGAVLRKLPTVLGAMGEPLTFQCLPGAVPGLLTEAGLTVRDLATAEELQRRFVPDLRPVFETCCMVLAEVQCSSGETS